MKQLIVIILGFIFFNMTTSCGSRDKSNALGKYNSEETKIKLNEILQKKVGSWIQEGSECYGLVMLTDKDGNVQAVKELKAIVLIVQNDKIKMKALEDVSLAPKAGCSKMGIAKGETWWETEGDLFQSKEEAIEFGKTIKIEKESPIGTKFTID